MHINPIHYAQQYFSHARIYELYKDIREYLPRKRFRQFTRSWVVNNLIAGPRKRGRFQRLHGCTLPAVINVSPTQKCNLHCTGCYAASYSRNAEMTTEQVEMIVTQAKELGIYFVGFLGGEPFYRKDLLRVIENHKEMAFRISTNGTIIDGEIIDALKRCGNLVTFFSLEGFEDETDAWRGTGVFGQIADTMAVFKQERILFGFSALVHTQNRGSIVSSKFLDAMRDAGCRFGLFFPYGPAGERARYDLRLSEEQIASLYAQLSHLEKNYSMLIRKEGYYPHDNEEKSAAEQGCRAGVTIHVTPEGFVEPCNGIQFFTENVFEKGLARVFQSPFYHDIFSCVQEHGRGCISMSQPREVLDIIKKHGARGSHPRALPTYHHYANLVSPGGDIPVDEVKTGKEEL